MPRLQSANNVTTRLAAAITAADTTLVVTDSSKLPAVPFRISIGNEILEVTAIDANTLTVERGREGSAAADHVANEFVNHSFTAGTYDELLSTTEVLTVDPTDEPVDNQGKIGQLLSKISNRIKTITGKANWFDNPRTTLDDALKRSGDKMDGILEVGNARTKLSGFDAQNNHFIRYTDDDADLVMRIVRNGVKDYSVHTYRKGVESRLWHEKNDGKGSGLDADLFRGRNIRDSTRASLLTNTAVATTIQFPLGMTAGAEAVSDPSGRFVYVETPNNVLTTARFFRRDFEEMWNFPGAGIAGWQELSPVSTIGQVWQDGADLLVVYNDENTAGYDIYAIFGGPIATNTKAFARYNVDTDTWTRLADLPDASLPGSFIVAGENRDEIYFIAGSKAAAAPFLYRYNVSTGTWSASLANVPAAMTTNSGTCGARAGRHIFMKLGLTASVVRFDTFTNVLQGPTAIGTAAAAGAKMIYMEGGLFLMDASGGTATPLCQENYFTGLSAGNAVSYSYAYNGSVLFDALGKVYFGAGNNTVTMLSWGY